MRTVEQIARRDALAWEKVESGIQFARMFDERARQLDRIEKARHRTLFWARMAFVLGAAGIVYNAVDAVTSSWR